MKDITPEDSLVPIYLDPTPPEIVAQDAENAAKIEAEKVAAKAKRAAALAKLEALGLDEDDLKALSL